MVGKSSTVSTSATRISAMQIQRSASGAPITWIGGTPRVSPNLIYYNDFESVAHTTKSKSGGKGGGGVTSTNTTYTYYAALILGIGRGAGGEPLSGVLRVFRDKEVFEPGTTSALEQAGLGFADGDRDQPVWGHLTTKHPDEALAYSETAYAYAPRYQLNDSAGVQNHTFEVQGPFRVGELPDAQPADLLRALLVDDLDGCGFDPAAIGDLTDYATYCLAENLLLSPALDEQEPASDVVKRWLQLTNADVVWSAGLLKVRPYGDVVVTANGTTWYPDVTPVAELGMDDFLADDGEPPVSFKLKSAADSYNVVPLEFLDRNNQYNTDVSTAQDLAAIEQYGRRPMDTVSAHEICDATIAAHAAQLLVQRNCYVRNQYEFKLGWQWLDLEAMDYVTLTEPELGLDAHLVRLVSVEEGDDGRLTVVAEDALLGVGSAPSYPVQGKGGYTGNQNAAPGPVLPPVVFNPPESLLLSGEHQVWVAVAGAGEMWGGCEVWISADGDSYGLAGTLYGRARHGELLAALPTGDDPDTENTLSVQLATPDELTAATTTEADSGATLCWLEGELLSYRDATLTGVGAYDLAYLRRGRLSTTIAAHALGARFVRLDDAIWKYDYTEDQVGATVWLKFRSFNVFGRGAEDLADVVPYSTVLSVARVGPAAATALVLVGAFEGPSFTVSWQGGARAEDHLVRIRHGGSNVVLREVALTSTGYSYSRDDALVDGALVRSYRVEVIARNAAGNAAPAELLVTNTAPDAVTGVSAVRDGTAADVSCTASTAADAAGYLFVYSTDPGFDPGSSGTLGYQGSEPSARITGLASGTTYYLRAAAYDTWSSVRSQLNWAPVVTIDP